MIDIRVLSPTYVTVTRTPGFLRRLFGAEESTRYATRIERLKGFYAWLYDDGYEVSSDVEEAIERAVTIRAHQERIALTERRP